MDVLELLVRVLSLGESLDIGLSSTDSGARGVEQLDYESFFLREGYISGSGLMLDGSRLCEGMGIWSLWLQGSLGELGDREIGDLLNELGSVYDLEAGVGKGLGGTGLLSLGDTERRRIDGLLVSLLLGVDARTGRRLVDVAGGLLGLLGVEDVRLLVDGLPLAVELRRRCLRVLLRRVVSLVPEHRPQIRCPEDIWSLVSPVLSIAPVEQLWVLALDTKQRVLAVQCIGQGTIDSAVLSPREVYRWLLSTNAAIWALAHNHPSGDPTPSPEDIRITQVMKQAGDLMRIELLDHIIVGKNDFRSLRQLGHI